MSVWCGFHVHERAGSTVPQGVQRMRLFAASWAHQAGTRVAPEAQVSLVVHMTCTMRLLSRTIRPWQL
jgi:hypothetical protein